MKQKFVVETKNDTRISHASVENAIIKELAPFKSKEELIKEALRNGDVVSPDAQFGYRLGMIDAFKSFAERLDFYRKYRYLGCIDSDEESFREYLDEVKKNDPVLWDKFFTFITEDERAQDTDWNEWLFDRCFDGVK